jgi:amino acid transporter
MSSGGSEKLSLFDACGMAIGGMVGGGIFAVLGAAVTHAGHAAWITFGLAGLLALITGVSYSRLTLSFDESGGSFDFLEHLANTNVAGTLSWFLLLGYVFAISLYAHTFGSYFAELVGLHRWGSVFGVAVIALIIGINVLGVQESSLAEDILVYTKVLILVGLTCVGFMAADPSKAVPVVNQGWPATLSAAGLVFVAYQGFQLLTYDYDEIEDRQTTLPRAITISILSVTLLYAAISFVTVTALEPETIRQHRETVLAYVAEPILGRPGFVLVLVAAVLSTASAIHATVFATARLGRRIGDDTQLPTWMTQWRIQNLPLPFLVSAGLLACVVQFFGNIDQIATFSSVVFLAVFSVVNTAALFHDEYSGWSRLLPALGTAGCLGASVLLGIDLIQKQPAVATILGGIAVAVFMLRGTFHLFRQDSPMERS